jgi:hypothetical protein
METMKIVEVNAINEDDARDKAEAKVNKRNDKWTAEQAYLKTGDN